MRAIDPATGVTTTTGVKVSTGGGEEPAWSVDGRERTYDVARDGSFLMVEEPPSPSGALAVIPGWTRRLEAPRDPRIQRP